MGILIYFVVGCGITKGCYMSDKILINLTTKNINQNICYLNE